MTPWEKLREKQRKERIKLVLDQLKKSNNKSQCANALGISRQRLNGFMSEHKINYSEGGNNE